MCGCLGVCVCVCVCLYVCVCLSLSVSLSLSLSLWVLLNECLSTVCALTNGILHCLNNTYIYIIVQKQHMVMQTSDDTAMRAAIKSVFKRQPRTITVCAFKNGTRDTFIHASAPTLKIVSAFKIHTFTSVCAL